MREAFVLNASLWADQICSAVRVSLFWLRLGVVFLDPFGKDALAVGSCPIEVILDQLRHRVLGNSAAIGSPVGTEVIE